MDLAAHLAQFSNDCDPDTVIILLHAKTSSVWQRAAYLLYAGGNEAAATTVLAARPHRKLVHVTLGDSPDGEHVAECRVTDRLVAPLLAQVGKA